MLRKRIGPRGFPAVIALLGVATAVPALAQNALPTNGHVVAGSVTIAAPVGNTLSINQTSNRAVINWNSFSVGQPNTVDFTQPSSTAAILNRVTGATPSSIAGQINANGQVYLVNPNGIVITPSGSVQVGGGFVASTLGIATGDFMSGNLAFTGNGASAGVSNAGSIGVGAGGYAALIGGTVANSGVISVPLGKVALGSGEQATLDLNGDGFMQVAVPTGTTTAKGQALVGNSGRIEAAGGTVELRAATVATAIRDAVNMSGVVAANSVSGHDGAITLDGGAGGQVRVTGTLDASAPAVTSYGPASLIATANGGRIAVDGARVRVGHRAVLNASGAKGGSVLVGVSVPGGVNEAARTTIASGAQILANGSATIAGSGGYIETSGVALKLGNATISAGPGGTWLTDPSNLIIDATAATIIDTALAAGTNVTEQTTATGFSGVGNVVTGNGDVDVASALSWNTAATLTLSAFNNITVSAPITVSGAGTLVLTYNNNQGGINTAGALSFVMGQGSAQFTSQASNPALFINNGTPGSGNGTQYTLIYDTSATLGVGIQSLNNSSGNFALAVPLDATSLGTLTTALIPKFSGNFNGLGNTVSNLTINSAVGFDNVGLFGQVNSGVVIANLGVTGGSVTGFSTANVGGLAGSNIGTVFNSYATVSVNGGAGSGGLVGVAEGSILQSYATGAVSGGSIAAGGLVGELNGGTISNSFATGSVSGGGDAGGLAGYNSGAVTSSFSTGAVAGGPHTGGLIGENPGAVTSSYWDTTSSGNLTGVGTGFSSGVSPKTTLTLGSALPAGFSASVWGNVNNQVTPYILTNPGPVLVGSEEGTSPPLYSLVFTPTQLQNINNSLAGHFALAQDIDMTGVAGFTPIGQGPAFTGTFNGLGNVVSNLTINDTTDAKVGLFGVNTGLILNVGVIGGSVTGAATNALIGGLVGFNHGGFVENSYSTATVTGTSSGSTQVIGGLVGQSDNSGSIVDAYATGKVSGASASFAGGLVGAAAGGSILNVYATGAVSGGDVGGLIGNGNANITDAYAAGSVSGNASSTGGFIGLQGPGGSVTNGYWNTDRAGTLTGVGTNGNPGVNPTGLSGTQPFTKGSYAGFTFTTTPGAGGNAWVLVDADGGLNNAGGVAGATMPMLAFEAQSTIQNAHQLQLMQMNVAGSYTLGRNIDATTTGSSSGVTTGTDVWGTAGFVPINGVSGFTGTFSGLSSIGAINTITNLTINSVQSGGGLFDVVGTTGTVSNVGLINVAVSDSVFAAGVGGLAGGNNGTIFNTYTTGTVKNGVSGFDGGLVGSNSSSGSISTSFSGATVSNCSGCDAGGLVGSNGGTITDTYTTSGGLVGLNQGTITDAYTVGPGGAGLADNIGTIIDGYYDAGTTGGSLGTAGGVTGLTTAALQAALPTLQNPSKWGIIAGKSYPYLCFQFGNCGETPQAVSGTVYTNPTGTTPAGSGITVNGLINGSAFVSAQTGGAVSTGANGYYYYLLAPNTIEPFRYVLTYAQNYAIGGGQTASGATLSNAGASVSGLDIYANTLRAITTETAYSAVVSDLDTADGLTGPVATFVNSLQNLRIDASGAFSVDAPISYPSGTVTLNADGVISNVGSQGVTATTLTGSSVGGASLLQGNAVGTFGPWTDTGTGSPGITFNDSTALATSGTIQSLGPIALTTATGNLTVGGNLLSQGPDINSNTVTLNAAGAITIASAINDTGTTGESVTLSAGNGIAFNAAVTLQDQLTATAGTTASSPVAITQNAAGILTINSQTTLANDSNNGTITLTSNNTSPGRWSLSTTGSASNVSALDTFLFNLVASTVGGNLSVTATNSNLRALGAITVGGNLTLSATGGGQITLLNGTTVTAPSVTLNAGGGGIQLDASTTLGQSGATVNLNASGPVSENLLAAITASTLTGSSVGGASMPGANSVSTFGPWNDTGTGGILFTSGLTLTTAGLISSGGDVILSVITEPDLILNSHIAGLTVNLSANGNINQTAGGITAENLVASTNLDAGGSITLNSPTNAVNGNVTLTSLNTAGTALADGAISLANATGLTIASLGGLQSGVGTTGAVTVLAGGNLTIAAGATVTGDGVALSTPGNFANNDGAAAVTATGGGRWLIYSNAPAGDTFGSLNSGDTAVWGATFATLPPASVTAGGDRYLFAQTQTLTVTTTSLSKTYDQDATAAVAGAFTTSGLAQGVANAFLADTAATVFSGAPSVTSTGSATTASVAGGPYPIVATAGSLSLESGYSLAFANTGQLTVSPVTLTAAIIGNPTKVYDGTTTAALASGNFTLAGFVAGQGATVAALTGSYVTANAATGIGVTANLVAGEFTANGGTVLSNYTLPTTAAGTGTITPASLTASITGNPTKIYDGTTTAALSSGDFVLSGFVAGQGATVSALTGSYATANAATGIGVSANLVAGEFTANAGTLLGNYTLPATAAGTGAITPASLTATIIGNPTKIYDGTTTAALGSGNFTLAGFVAGQGATVSALTGNYVSANAASEIVVNANLVAGEFTANGGTVLSNYTLPTTAAGTGTITPASLTASIIGNPTKAYDGTTTAALASGNFTLSGFIAGQGATVLALTGSYATANAATGIGVSANLVAGEFTANGSTLLGNYTLPTTAAGTGAITAAPLTAAIIGNPTKIYDGTTTAALASGNFTLTGFVAGQGATVSGVTGDYASANAANGIAVNASLVPGEFTANGGTLLGNYALPTTAAGTGTITPASLTASIIGNPTKAYDGTTTAALASGNFTLSGFVAGQGATVSALTGSYASANVGNGIGVSANLVAGEFTANGGTVLSNYTLPTTAAGTGTIAPAALTVTADVFTKIYGNSLSFAGTEFTINGLVANDTVTSVSLASAGTAATAGVGGSPYPVTASAAVGTGLSNYAITYLPGTLTVTPRPITVTANDLSRPFSQPNPPLTFAVTAGNLANGDVLSGALTTPAISGSLAGPYPITQGTLAATSNYGLTFIGGTLVVMTVPDFGVSPNKYIAPGPTVETSQSGLTLCSPGDLALVLDRAGSVVVFGAQQSTCSNM